MEQGKILEGTMTIKTAVIILFLASFSAESKTSQHWRKLKTELDFFKSSGTKADKQIETLNKRMKEVEDTLRYHRLKIPSDNLTAGTLAPSNPASSGSKALKEFNLL